MSQEKKIKSEPLIEPKVTNEVIIKSFNELVELCSNKKEMKLKFELEKNVNLVKFETGRIEISFNDNLDKDFVNELTFKLHEWTGQRWIISFSKEIGQLSKKKQRKLKNSKLLKTQKEKIFTKKYWNYFQKIRH